MPKTNIPNVGSGDAKVDKKQMNTTSEQISQAVFPAQGLDSSSDQAVQAVNRVSQSPLNAVQGVLGGAGMGASAVNPMGSSTGNFLQGFMAGMQAPAKIYAAKQAQLKATIDASPLSATYGSLAERYPAFAGMPTAIALQHIQAISKDAIDLYTKKQEIESQMQAQEELQNIDESNARAYRQAVTMALGSNVAKSLDIVDESGNVVPGGALIGMRKSDLSDYVRSKMMLEKPTVSGTTGTSLTPEAIDMAARKSLATGELPSFGMGASASYNKVAVLNRASEIAKAEGLTVQQQNLSKAANKAATSALAKQTVFAQQVMGFEETAQKNLAIAEELSGNVSRTDIPMLNKYILEGKMNIGGDSKVAQFYSAVNTFANEYAKVMSGSTGGAAVTDAARKEAQHLIDVSFNKEQFKAAANLARKEMDNRRAALHEEIANTTKLFGNTSTGVIGSQNITPVSQPKPQPVQPKKTKWNY